jgi:hypothetical protein
MPDGEEFLDPYLDPETGILRNLAGARTKAALDDAEASLSFARLVQLMDRPPKPTGDLTELRATHRHLFQDLYDWAGQVRTVDIRKNVEGAGFFLPSGMIERASAFAAGELHADNMLAVWTVHTSSTGSPTTTTRSTTSTRSARATAACSGCSGTASPWPRDGSWTGGRPRRRQRPREPRRLRSARPRPATRHVRPDRHPSPARPRQGQELALGRTGAHVVHQAHLKHQPTQAQPKRSCLCALHPAKHAGYDYRAGCLPVSAVQVACDTHRCQQPRNGIETLFGMFMNDQHVP